MIWLSKRFVLEPRTNHTESEVNDHPGILNGLIKEYEGNKFVDDYYADPTLVKNLEKTGNLVKPEDYSTEGRVLIEEGIEKGWKPLPEGKLGAGLNPFKQLIYRTVRVEGGCDFDRIVDALLNEYRVLPKEDYVVDSIRDLVIEMNEKHPVLLLRDGKGGWKIGDEMELGRLYPFKEGYDPREYALTDWMRGSVSYPKMRSFLMERLEWVGEADTVKTIVENLEDKGVLENTVGNMYRVEGELEPIQS